MKLTSNGTDSKLWLAALCGMLSVFFDFVFLPQVFILSTRVGFPIPDPIWILMMILIPMIVAIYILEQKPSFLPKYVWIGLPVQYLILIVFAKPISQLCGIGISGIRVMEYIWEATVWPLSVTTAQFVSLVALHTWKSKHKKQ